MITADIIEEVKKRLIKTYDPLELYLFGSYAWGNPTEDSDLDILIVTEKTSPNKHKLLVMGHHALIGLNIPKDILVFSKSEFDSHAADITKLCYKVKREGKKIYAKS